MNAPTPTLPEHLGLVCLVSVFFVSEMRPSAGKWGRKEGVQVRSAEMVEGV